MWNTFHNKTIKLLTQQLIQEAQQRTVISQARNRYKLLMNFTPTKLHKTSHHQKLVCMLQLLILPLHLPQDNKITIALTEYAWERRPNRRVLIRNLRQSTNDQIDVLHRLVDRSQFAQIIVANDVAQIFPPIYFDVETLFDVVHIRLQAVISRSLDVECERIAAENSIAKHRRSV